MGRGLLIKDSERDSAQRVLERKNVLRIGRYIEIKNKRIYFIFSYFNRTSPKLSAVTQHFSSATTASVKPIDMNKRSSSHERHFHQQQSHH
jgi:hypothetical protein